jgi:hypothetical protein
VFVHLIPFPIFPVIASLVSLSASALLLESILAAIII